MLFINIVVEKSLLACKIMLRRQSSRSQSQTLLQDNKAEMPEEHLDRSLSRLQSLYNFVITVQ